MCVWTRQLLVLCGVFGLGAAFHGGALAQEEPPPTPIARYSGPFVIGGGGWMASRFRQKDAAP